MSLLARAYGPTDGLAHEPTDDHSADDIADRLTKELRHVREILKTVDLGDVEALLSDIEVCPGEFANASAARPLNLIDNAKVESQLKVN